MIIWGARDFGASEDEAIEEQGERPLIVVGITHPQTCLVLTGRLRALRDAGFRVLLACSPGDSSEAFVRHEGVGLVPIPLKRSISPFADLVAFVRLCRALRRLRPEIVEFSTPKAGLLGSVAAFLCRVPCRIYLLRGLRLETASGWKQLILQLSERLAGFCSNFVLCISPSLLNKAHELKTAPPHKLLMLANGTSNGVDVRRFRPGSTRVRADFGIQHGAPVIGFVGRLTCDKGVPDLLVAFRAIQTEFPDARLLLVGWYDDSDDALPIRERQSIEKDPAVIVTGFVPDTSIYYRAMDVMVLPTLREGFPNAVLEAGACQVPVVTTMATGARDAVVPDVTGILVPAGEPGAICRAVTRLLEDRVLRRTMGLAAREWIVDRYDHRRVHALTVEFYKGLLRRKAAAALCEASVPIASE